jgi:hypothetical protein
VSHLGERVAALVDGQLATDAAERATLHLTECRPCRDAFELERLIKHRLGSMGTPEPSTDFVTALVLMAGPDGPLPPRERRIPVVTGAPAQPAPPAFRTAGTTSRPPGRAGGSSRPAAGSSPAARRRRPSRTRPRLAAAALAAACLVGAGVTIGGVAAGSTAGSPRIAPQVDTLVSDRGSAEATLPLPAESVIWSVTRSGR